MLFTPEEIESLILSNSETKLDDDEGCEKQTVRERERYWEVSVCQCWKEVVTVVWRHQSPGARRCDNMNPEPGTDTVCREIWDSDTSISHQGGWPLHLHLHLCIFFRKRKGGAVENLGKDKDFEGETLPKFNKFP